MRLGFRIAVRFLKSNKGQTLLIILGIAIGVSVQIFIGSLIQGLQKSLVDKTIGNSSQITITSNADDAAITDYKQLLYKIQLSDSNIKNLSVASDHAAFLEHNGKSQSLLVRGLDLKQSDAIYNINDRIIEGTVPKKENEIILGIDLKDEYTIDLNDKVDIITPDRKLIACKVVGFFDLKVSNLNTGWGITSLKTAQTIFNTGNTVTSIEMQVADNAIFTTDKIATKLKAVLNQEDLKIVNWKAQNESLLSGLQGQSISSYMIQIFVMISVVLGISSVLAITVLQKSRQIGILKAMGIHNLSSSYIFLFEGLILGFFGALLGILFGLGLSFAFTKFAVNSDGTPIIDLFISLPFITLSGIIATIASVVAALIPAIRSSRLNPIDIIRNN
jgi:lipoprotein-releasing system permease protein